MGNRFPTDFGAVQAAPEFAVDANRISIFKIFLDNAHSGKEIVTGASTMLWAVDASDIGANVNVALNDQNNGHIPVSRGMVIRGVRFSRLYITSDAQSGQWITLFVAREDTGNIQIENPAIALNEISLRADRSFTSSVDVSVPAGGSVQVSPQSNTRREIAIQNRASSLREVRIGGSNVAANIGYELQPGQTLFLRTAGAIYAYNPHSADQDVTIVEIGD